MKKAFLLLLIVVSLTDFSYSKDRELARWNSYKVEKTTKNDSLKSNECLILGIAKNTDDQPVVAGVFSRIDRQQRCSTDAEGQFEFLFKKGGPDMYFYHPEYGEIIIPASIVKLQHTVEISITMIRQAMEVEVEKPVIYLYAKEPTSFSIELKPVGELTFTYPEYKSKWMVTANEQGQLTSDFKKYPYLFWEAKQKRLNFKGDANGMEGFYLKTDTLVNFLEIQLEMLGLNNRESTDFITYWGPRMKAYQYVAVQFWIDDMYAAEIAEINVQPKPEAVRRVFMVFRGVNEDMNVDYFIPQKWNRFIRKDLTLIEWGGAEIK